MIESVDDDAGDAYMEYKDGLIELVMKRCVSFKQESDEEQRSCINLYPIGAASTNQIHPRKPQGQHHELNYRLEYD